MRLNFLVLFFINVWCLIRNNFGGAVSIFLLRYRHYCRSSCFFCFHVDKCSMKLKLARGVHLKKYAEGNQYVCVCVTLQHILFYLVPAIFITFCEGKLCTAFKDNGGIQRTKAKFIKHLNPQGFHF